MGLPSYWNSAESIWKLTTCSLVIVNWNFTWTELALLKIRSFGYAWRIMRQRNMFHARVLPSQESGIWYSESEYYYNSRTWFLIIMVVLIQKHSQAFSQVLTLNRDPFCQKTKQISCFGLNTGFKLDCSTQLQIRPWRALVVNWREIPAKRKQCIPVSREEARTCSKNA